MLNRRAFLQRIGIALGSLAIWRRLSAREVAPDAILRQPSKDEDIREQIRELYNLRARGLSVTQHPRTIHLGSDAYARFEADLMQNERFIIGPQPNDPPGKWLWFKTARVYPKGSGWGMTIVA